MTELEKIKAELKDAGLEFEDLPCSNGRGVWTAVHRNGNLMTGPDLGSAIAWVMGWGLDGAPFEEENAETA